ncbi:Guanine nucleotide binding protein beta subunit [Spraguea lophii 42_110]|uniref:Guanine nucleotide binding protein beta subunit n=1 Tax=Spraguea lophii (strain 42_110) TaxID=1358809 RepID=S7XVG3_SPRLO|nr:Chain SGG, Guanine nucleotide binding protein beta subunit [Spraguea lophii 42_110]7QJH_RGG Chain RGG, Guanine nucleotide binding protein beta subunit [Spraguea lophii 42_110]7QJH_SGG Chain SGG, Guanine nucleotide binding protein beta subunit [Spraguea lophii 42_110]8BR3_SGG Chain SGG, Guanine nucleotide binding protein beta subunit [Spraguea lophii 42_110]8P5D_SGG Chain SGG, Guanine nucleotide binding protein beta subunit [Spraguea lophii 42_110]8P60_RGG Chain RGG, Guanine nucleotide bindi
MISLNEKGSQYVHKQMVTCLEVPNEGNSDILYTASRDKKIYSILLKPEEDKVGKYIKSYEGHSGFVNCITTNSSNDKIISGSSDNTARIFDVESQKSVVLKGHTRDITSISINTEDNKIITGSVDGKIMLWNTQGKCAEVFDGECQNTHTSWINCVAFRPFNSNIVVSGSEDGTLKIWDIEEKRVMETFINGFSVTEIKEKGIEIERKSAVTSLSMSPDGSLCAYGSKNSMVYVFKFDDNKCVINFDAGSTVKALAFGLTDVSIACATESEIILWDILKNVRIARIDYSSYGNGVYCTSLVWAKDMLLAGFSDGRITAYERTIIEE